MPKHRSITDPKSIITAPKAPAPLLAALQRQASAARPDYASIGRSGAKRRENGAPRDTGGRHTARTAWRPGHR